MQIQVILSLVAILSAAAIALWCDYIRRKNEQLRAAMVELKVRKYVAEVVPASVTTTAPERTVRSQLALPAPAAVSASPVQLEEKPLVRQATPQAPPQHFPQALTSRRRRPPAPASAEMVESGIVIKDEDMNSKQALSDWLIKKAVARAAQIAESEAQAKPLDRLAARVPETATPKLVSPPVSQPAEVESNAVEAVRVPGFTPAFEPVVIDDLLWQSLFSNKPEPSAPKRMERSFELIQRPPAPAEVMIPAGFHEGQVLADLIERGLSFSGLVISIGVSTPEADGADAGAVMRKVADFLQTQLRSGDFLCAASDEEFILLSSGEAGREAQRHLSEVSESLWDYQLRLLGTMPMVFSLGGAEVQRENLRDAVKAATERMQQTWRGRKAIMMPSPSQRKKAV